MRSHLGFMNYQSSIFENKHFPMGCYSSDCQECSFTDSAKRLYTSRDIFTYSMKNIVGMGGKLNRFPVKTPLLYCNLWSGWVHAGLPICEKGVNVSRQDGSW